GSPGRRDATATAVGSTSRASATVTPASAWRSRARRARGTASLNWPSRRSRSGAASAKRAAPRVEEAIRPYGRSRTGGPWPGPLRLAAATRDRDLARAHHLHQPERADHPLEGLDLVGGAGDLDDDRALRHVDDLAAEDLADLHDLGALVPVDGDLEQRQLARDRLGGLEVAD